MCILAILNNPTPTIRQMVLHNRDELLSRPFASGRWHTIRKQPALYYGTDEAAGGTWLSISENRWAAVLNLRLPHEPAPSENYRSRGELPLLAQSSTDTLFQTLMPEDYRPFRLIVGAPAWPTLQYASIDPNRPPRPHRERVETYTNHAREKEVWFKEERIEALLGKSLITPDQSPEDLAHYGFEVLADSMRSQGALPTYTGRSPHDEFALSSIQVNLPEHNYGTVVSTVILYPSAGGVLIWERNHLTQVTKFHERVPSSLPHSPS